MKERRHDTPERNPVRRKSVPGTSALDGLISLLISLVLVHGLVASPLLVECIPSDGSSLVEFIGQDPCHHFLGASRSSLTAERHAADFEVGDLEDPCVDLTLDSFGLTQSLVDVQAPPVLPVDQLADSGPVAAHTIPDSNGSGCSRLAREPVTTVGCSSLQASSLRI